MSKWAQKSFISHNLKIVLHLRRRSNIVIILTGLFSCRIDHPFFNWALKKLNYENFKTYQDQSWLNSLFESTRDFSMIFLTDEISFKVNNTKINLMQFSIPSFSELSLSFLKSFYIPISQMLLFFFPHSPDFATVQCCLHYIHNVSKNSIFWQQNFFN